MKKIVLFGLIVCLGLAGGVFLSRPIRSKVLLLFTTAKQVHFAGPVEPTPKPLQIYSFIEGKSYPFQKSSITVEKQTIDAPTFTTYQFSFTTLGKRMSGLMNVPKVAPTGMILLVRGYVPLEKYQPGVGTKSAATFFAEHGFITFSPDFFGYGSSDPETLDIWEARFQKPFSLVELIMSLQSKQTVTLPGTNGTITLDQPLGLWAHSNGGQITLSALELLQQPIPTTLWAPVTAPFPYSILYFSDEDQDEGHAARASVSQFEHIYDVKDFSLTDHLDLLTGPLQIHQGLEDESIHYTWSQKFVDKVKTENARRDAVATQSAQPAQDIAITLFTYPGTNHNMQPAWSTIIQRDLEFFTKYLGR